MRPLRIMVVLTLVVALAPMAGAAPAPSYLFDVLHRPIYRTAWMRMLAGQGGLPRWLVQYARAMDGPATPGTVRTIAGAQREFYHVCEAHNCGDSQFEVMFSGDGETAKGLLTVEGQPPRFLGSPDAVERRALVAANNE